MTRCLPEASVQRSMSRGVSTSKRNPREIPAGVEATFISARNGELARRSPEWFVASAAEGNKTASGTGRRQTLTKPRSSKDQPYNSSQQSTVRPILEQICKTASAYLVDHHQSNPRICFSFNQKSDRLQNVAIILFHGTLNFSG